MGTTIVMWAYTCSVVTMTLNYNSHVGLYMVTMRHDVCFQGQHLASRCHAFKLKWVSLHQKSTVGTESRGWGPTVGTESRGWGLLHVHQSGRQAGGQAGSYIKSSQREQIADKVRGTRPDTRPDREKCQVPHTMKGFSLLTGVLLLLCTAALTCSAYPSQGAGICYIHVHVHNTILYRRSGLLLPMIFLSKRFGCSMYACTKIDLSIVNQRCHALCMHTKYITSCIRPPV